MAISERSQTPGGDTGDFQIRKVIEIPAVPADPEQLPPLLKGFGAVPPLVTDINLSLDDRFLYVSCWGTGELRQYDVSDLRLYRHQHVRGAGMRVGMAGLTGWSFLMASCHGAGLMVLPFLLRITTVSAHAGHHQVVSGGPDPIAGAAVTALHMAGYLAVTAAVAVVVYERLGLQLLRRLWFNLDVMWAAALIATAAWTVWS